MSSGVTVDAAIPPLFHDMKFKKTLKVAFFRISDDGKRIIVDEEKQIKPSEKDPYGAFIRMLPTNECRYIVFDVAYGTKESGDKTSLLFIAWAPEDSSVKAKMVHASSKDYLKKELGLDNEWDLHDMADAMNIREMGAKLKGALCVEGRDLGCH
ncbi:cofilin-2-like [Hippocampus zosterae]|uniref:cofilin-2-like n=1 Tax=Hippocampus zosterae TaxID=109293 RepID=UPI00223D3563|nr:cofilin-2-like [Hippocampus zosterae]XP_051942079.1 cofilin-2-like [Hippocampus zosterae]